MRTSKRIPRIVGALAIGLTIFGVSRTVEAQTDHSEALRKFQQLQAASSSGGRAKFGGGSGTATRTFDINNSKIQVVTGVDQGPSIDSGDPNTPPIKMGVAIWGELAQGPQAGQKVNFIKHKWQRREQFYVWVESAVPVQLSIFQEYAEGGPQPKPVIPDPAYPSTFATVMPGQPFKIPVVFEMDDNLQDELMSIVVVRAQSGILPMNSAAGNALGSSPNGGDSNTSGVGGAIKASQAKFAGLNQQASSTGSVNGASTKFVITGPDESLPPISNEPDDVEFVCMGFGDVGRLMLVLHKD